MAIMCKYQVAGIKKEKPLTAMKACREKCLDCCCGQEVEVRKCTSNDCPLYNFRMGKYNSKSERINN